MIWRLWRRLRDWWQWRNLTADEMFADAVMTHRHRQQWQRTRGTIEQRLQAMLIARNEDGQPCWTQEDWQQIYRLLKNVQEGRE